MRAWRHRATCREPTAAASWTAAIARREAYRRAGAKVDLLGGTGEQEPDLRGADELEVIAIRVDLERELSGLTPEDRRLLELRYHSDLTQRAVAAALDLPEGTVKVRLHRLRKLLHERLR